MDPTESRGFRLGFGAESIFYLLLMAFGCLCIDTTVVGELDFMVVEYLDSALYSQVVGVLLIVSAVFLWWRAWREKARPGLVSADMLGGMALTFAYVVGFTFIGFYISTFAFLCVCAWLIEQPGERNLAGTLVFAAVSTLALYALFTAFKIYLPTAWLV